MAGTPSPFTCPDCGGQLWESREGDVDRYQCHVGHRFSADGLVAAHTDGLERALWTALRVLEEHVALRQRMADRARRRGMTVIADAYERRAAEHKAQAAVVRRALVSE